jgi:hypothetical protein
MGYRHGAIHNALAYGPSYGGLRVSRSKHVRAPILLFHAYLGHVADQKGRIV